MKKRLSWYLFFFFVSHAAMAQHPQKFDSLYKTIFAKDLCELAEQNPGIVLLDVRSAGEYSDTSQYNSLNMGHLKGAINMEIDTMKKNPAILDQFRDKTLIVYCSHSQRSRRVSKLLAENGFSNFYNLNGGMSHLNQMTTDEFPCKKEWIVSGLGYKNVSNAEAVDMLKSEPDLVVVDIRPELQFVSKDSAAENNIGRVRGAINIPYANLKQRLSELEKHKQKPILLYVASGDGDAARAATELASAGFTSVYHLLGGLNDLVASDENLNFLEPSLPFKIVNPVRALKLLKNESNLAIYDTRPASEFENRDKLSWKNLGNIRNAINVAEKDFEHYSLPTDKALPILVYGRGEAYQFAGMLAKKGYKKVYLMNGLYDFFWSSYNVEECRDAKKFLVNHAGIY
ncbi:MAG: rhodanese-like protein [Ferruginibacter sp.]|nr:rhodanese-like protein [Ferruginibacter sp.]